MDVLSEYKSKGITVPCVTGFNIVSEHELTSEIPILEQYSNGVRDSVFDKRAIFDVDFDMSYTSGCHSYGSGFELMKKTFSYKSSNDKPIALLHYKHIGNLLYESSVKNLERFDQTAIKVDEQGRHKGPGSHYAFYKNLGENPSPLLRKAENIFDEEMNVLFENFSPSTGERGTKDISGQVFDKFDVDAVRDSGLVLEAEKPELALKLMKIALKFRPGGTAIEKRVLALEERLKH